MKTVIGLDPSLVRTGVAVWQEGRMVTFSVPTQPSDGPRVVRQRIISQAIMPWVSYGDHLRRVDDDDTRRDTLVVIEAVHASRLHKGRTALDLAGLHDVLVYQFYGRGITVGVAQPQVAKIMATGRGNATKQEVKAAAADVLGLQCSTTDESDAAWFMATGVVAGGGAIASWPGETLDKARAAQLTKVDWIGLLPDPDWLGDFT